MAFFRNTAVNLLNLHYAIHSIALSGGGAFFAAYMIEAGVSVPGVFLAFALILVGRFALRPQVVPLVVRFGLRPMLIAGTLLSALQYLFLAEIDGVGWALAGLVAMGAIGDTVYWSTYHAYFAALGDDEHRGSQIGIREAIAALVGVVSPLIAGRLLVSYGPLAAFGANAVMVALSALPLLRTPDIVVKPLAPGAYRAALLGFKIFLTDGFIAAGYVFVWQIALFLSLKQDLMAFGGALALAAVVAAIAGVVLGHQIDAGHRKRAIVIAYVGMAGVIILRAFAIDHGTLAVAANAVGAFGGCVYIPAIMTAVYTQAKRAPCVLRFHVVAEGGWDIGGATGLLIAAGLAWSGAPLWTGVLLSLIGVAAGYLIVRRYYADHPLLPIVPIPAEAAHP